MILGLDLRSGGLNRWILHEISIRIHWTWSRTPKPANKYKKSGKSPKVRPLLGQWVKVYLLGVLWHQLTERALPRAGPNSAAADDDLESGQTPLHIVPRDKISR